MGMPVLRRLLLVLTALAFVLATALPGTASAMPMSGGSMMAGDFGDQPCGDCPAKAPDSGTKMMSCSALACSGTVVALPTSVLPALPIEAAIEYPAWMPSGLRGQAPPPDPFPPRSSLLV